MTTLWITVPCYNEEKVLPETAKRLLEKLGKLLEEGRISKNSRIAFIDDGSTDGTWNLISGLCDENVIFAGIKLSRNKGHQYALHAGLMTAKEYADAVISMDADLQDDINVIDGFLDSYDNGCEVVYGVRSDRTADTGFKRVTAGGYYRLMKGMGVDMVDSHADCRLMSKRALEALSEYKEHNLFLRGLVPLVGFKSDTVYYVRHERFAGESKYPLKKMLAFAWEGMTSFSTKPLKLFLYLGIIMTAVSLAALIIMLIVRITGHSVSAAAVLAGCIFAACGINLTAAGVLGEYLGKIYQETKARPKYHIEKTIIS